MIAARSFPAALLLYALLACGAAWAEPDSSVSASPRPAGSWVAAYGLNFTNVTQFPHSSEYVLTPRMHYYLRPWLAMEGWLTVGGDWRMNFAEVVGGFGLLNGSRLGFGFRTTPLPTALTPCASIGIDVTSGTFGRKSEQVGTWNSEDVVMVIGPGLSGQVSGGLEFMARNGLFVLGEAQYQRLLTPENVRFVGKEPHPYTRREYTSLYHGRVTLSLSFGKAFGR